MITAASLGQVPALAAPLQPTGPWRVDYDNAQCVAMRDYGSAEKPLELVLKPSPNGGVMRLLVMRKGSATVGQAPVTLRLGDKQLKSSLLLYSNDKTHYRIASVNVPMSEFKAHLDATSIGMSGGVRETFAVSELDALTTELDKCLVDLQEYWNIGPVRADRISNDAKPEQPLWKLFSPNDYPGVAIMQGQSGRAKIVFLVDEQGVVSDCSVDETSGVSSLDTMSCYVLQTRAKFEPALGKDGKPVRSGYCERIVWKIYPGTVPKEKDSRPDPLCPEKPRDEKG